MSAPVRDLRAEVRAALAELAGADVVRIQDVWEWLDGLSADRLSFVSRLLGVTTDEPGRVS